MERKSKARAQTGIYLALVAAVVVVLNVFSFGAYKRFDVTDKKRFTLSNGSARLVREGLKNELKIEFYVTRAGPKYEAFITDVTDLLKEYERASNGKLKYTILEAKSEDEKKLAKDAGLQEANFGEGSETGKDQATITRGYMGLVFKYGSEQETIPVLSPGSDQGLEFWVSMKIRELRDRVDDMHVRIGVLTGKDELKLTDPNLLPSAPQRPSPSIRSVFDGAMKFYKFEDVDLKDGEEDINPDLSGLIITQLGKDLTEKEMKKIDEFLMRGNKALAVFAGAVNIKANDPSMRAELDLHGLDKLLDGYGVEMKKNCILDWGRAARLAIPTQGGMVGVALPPTFLEVGYDDRLDDKEQFLDQKFAGFFRLDELAFPFSSSLVAKPDKQPEAKVLVRARSTANATVDTSEVLEMKTSGQWKPKGEYGQHALAITVEGKLKSPFGGGTSPEASRILVVGSSQFLTNPLARAGNPPPLPPQMAMMGGLPGDEELQMISQPYAGKYLTNTILAFRNVLDWMSNDTDLIATSAKLIGDSKLAYTDIEKPKSAPGDDEAAQKKKWDDYMAQRKKVQTNVQWALTLGPALAFALLGIARWRLRESKGLDIKFD